MSYLAQLNNQLNPQPSTAYRVLDLFAGCAGLSPCFYKASYTPTTVCRTPYKYATLQIGGQ